MSYQVLARKWRPKSFAEVVGQAHVLKILSNALTLGRVHHAYLFSGTRGVGKTSIARLLAKGLNCETGITATPCGQCGNCLDIEQGRFVDLIEIDAASRTKVEDTREILDNIQYLPTRGRFKVYLIDEVHMLSRSSFNALLKTLEEPPEHVKFLLATTDPQKLPITILSRCLHLHLQMLDNGQITQQLEHILQAEKIPFQPRALTLLSKAANGSMRDALSLTDQAIALGNGEVDTTSVASMLGALDDNVPFSLMESLVAVEGNTLMSQISQAATQGADWETLLNDTLALLHQIALLQMVPTALGEYQHREARIRHLAQIITPQDVQLYYQILLEGKKTLNTAHDKKMVVEMAFLRAIAFQPKVFHAAQSTNSVNVAIDKPVNMPASQSPASPAAGAANSAETPSRPPSAATETVNAPPTLSTPPVSAPDIALPSATQQILQAREKLLSQGDPKPKKSERAAPAQPGKSSRFDSVKQGNFKRPEAFAEPAEDEPMSAENYQWQAKTVFETPVTTLTPKNLRQSVEEEKTPELVKKLIAEAMTQDSWSAEIEQLGLPPLIKQLAINAFLEQKSAGQLVLHLRAAQAHINKRSNVETLQALMSAHRQQPIELDIVIDDNLAQQTPLELRESIYQQKLQAAKTTIHQDEKIVLLCRYFNAQIDEESIRPV
ncbi:DNA polymerase III subunit gamma/tau [Utexia brackfieldae]|uniref:DNA polymerase III subunit gamma/tau n=1 Tax=Utexia brackfieldae TaxID=3074108 RepID=UPI00370D15B9